MPDAKGNNQDLEPVTLKARAQVLHKPGVERLDKYPKLVYAPAQWGPGIRTENNGTEVSAICAEIAKNPDHEAVARKFGITIAHVEDALRYAEAVSYTPPDAG